MQPSKRRHWNWLVSVAFAIVVAIVLNSGSQASHFGDSRYSSNGFHNIAQGNTVSYHIDPNAPNPGLARNAHAAWNATRAQGYVNYAVESSTRTNWQQVQWNHLAQENPPTQTWGTLIWRGPQGNCNLNPGPQTYCYSDITEPLDSNGTLGAMVHELGHALFGLADHIDGDCSTVMSGCWIYLTGPTSSDARAARRFYGIPDDPQFYPNYGGGTTSYICWNDNSVSETQYQVDLWKYNNGWQYLHSHTINRNLTEQLAEGWACFGENIGAEAGSGFYIYGVYGYNQFANGYTGWQFGGFSNNGMVQ
jgi:hypothetical protein